MSTEEEIASTRFHTVKVSEAKGEVVVRASYQPKVAYAQIFIPTAQNRLITLLNQYNDEKKLEGAQRVRLASPDIEYALGKLGCEHEAFDNQFERNWKDYIDVFTDTQLRRHGPNEYKEGTSKHPIWRRDVWKYDFNKRLWAKIAEGLKIPKSGMILEMDEALGLPTKTARDVKRAPESKEYWSFSPKKKNLAVARGGYWSKEHPRCLGLSAIHLSNPRGCYIFTGFRLVRGPVAKYEKAV